ncbi:MAG: glycosyltransferase family 4 protein [Armatimonadota bacterium]
MLSREFPPGPGGIGTHAYQLCAHLSRTGWNITVVTPQDYASEDAVRAFNARVAFKIVRVPSKRGAIIEAVHRLAVLKRCISLGRPDVVIASGERMVWLAAWALGRSGIPWVAVGHGSEFGEHDPLSRILTRRAFGAASAVVCVSHFTQQLMESAGVRARSIGVIHNGADDTIFRVMPDTELATFRRRVGLEGRKVIVTVGNVSERKGQHVVIRAMPYVLRDVPEAVYVIVGRPTKQQEFSALAKDLGVADHVFFTGIANTEDVVGYLNVADVFAMTSVRTASGDCEGYGIAVVEAALCGKPSVVSRSGGLTEAIADGLTGISVPEGDEKATADAIVMLLRNNDLRDRLGRAALERARSQQTWARCVARYDLLLRQIVQCGTTLASHR